MIVFGRLANVSRMTLLAYWLVQHSECIDAIDNPMRKLIRFSISNKC